jgi:hypothetical protein
MGSELTLQVNYDHLVLENSKKVASIFFNGCNFARRKKKEMASPTKTIKVFTSIALFVFVSVYLKTSLSFHFNYSSKL